MIYQKSEKHGYHIAYAIQEAEANEKNGWKTVTEEEFYKRDNKKTESEVDIIVESIEEKYEKKFGKRPHHRMKRESIEEAINADSTGPD